MRLTTKLLKEIIKEELTKAEKEKKELEKIPTPTGWRLVLFPLKLNSKTKSGLY